MGFRVFFFLVVGVCPLLEWALLCVLFLRPLHLPRPWELAAMGGALAFSQSWVWFRFLGGDILQPEMPRFLYYAIHWGSAFVFLLFALCLLPPYRWWRVRAVILAAIAALPAAASLFEGARAPRVRTRDLFLAGLPAEFDGFRLVHLSDLHASLANRAGRFEEIVRRANALSPDAICITGDFVDGSPGSRGDTLAPLSGLRARHGVFGCVGNHELYSPYAEWRPILSSYGVRMLEDTCVVLTNGAGRLAIGGLDYHFDMRRGEAVRPVARVFSDAPEDAFRILMRHVPVGLREAAAAGVALQLSGHTHGGQITGFDRLVAGRNEGHVRGLYEQDGVRLHVSPGTGQWAGFPFRFGIPSEITLLVLHPSRP